MRAHYICFTITAGEGRHPLTRLAYYVLFAYLVTSLSFFIKAEEFQATEKPDRIQL
jgi:hypothetical protein